MGPFDKPFGLRKSACIAICASVGKFSSTSEVLPFHSPSLASSDTSEVSVLRSRRPPASFKSNTPGLRSERRFLNLRIVCYPKRKKQPRLYYRKRNEHYRNYTRGQISGDRDNDAKSFVTDFQRLTRAELIEHRSIGTRGPRSSASRISGTRANDVLAHYLRKIKSQVL